jgi:hypothetical protein
MHQGPRIERPAREGRFGDDPDNLGNPGSVATTTPHNKWDYRTTALGIIVSAIVLTQVPLAHAARRRAEACIFFEQLSPFGKSRSGHIGGGIPKCD